MQQLWSGIDQTTADETSITEMTLSPSVVEESSITIA